jgi:hypothetical protein
LLKLPILKAIFELLLDSDQWLQHTLTQNNFSPKCLQALISSKKEAQPVENCGSLSLRRKRNSASMFKAKHEQTDTEVKHFIIWNYVAFM